MPRDGRGAHFAHVLRKGVPPCSWRSKPGLRSIGAVQYAGLQEGSLHLTRKLQLAECLRRDSRFSDVRVEKQIRIGDGRRQPDVSAVMDGRTIAFDIQLAVLPLSEILAREEFHAAHNIHHVDRCRRHRPAGPPGLQRPASAGRGRIFALDDAVVAASMASGQLQLIELSLLPRFRGFLPRDSDSEARQVDLAVIMLAPLLRKLAGEARYRETLRAQARNRLGHLRQRMRDAGAQGRSLGAVRAAYAEIAPQIQAPSFSRAEEDGLGLVFGWLGQLETCHPDTSIHRAAAVDELEVRPWPCSTMPGHRAGSRCSSWRPSCCRLPRQLRPRPLSTGSVGRGGRAGRHPFTSCITIVMCWCCTIPGSASAPGAAAGQPASPALARVPGPDFRGPGPAAAGYSTRPMGLGVTVRQAGRRGVPAAKAALKDCK